MKISLIEADFKRLDVDYNFALAEKLIKKAGQDDPDVIVLSEVFNTEAVNPEAVKLADEDGKRTKELLSKLAKETKAYIIGGSILEKRGDDIYNTSHVFDREGNHLGFYDKTHLYSTSGEKDLVKEGNDKLIFDIDRIKCGLVTCYDIEFPAWVTAYALEGVEVLFNPAAWHEDWIINWDSLVRARAIENQIFVVGVNSVGEAHEGHFGGHSQIVGPMADYIIDPNEKAEIKTAILDLHYADEYKAKYPILADRREDLY